MMRSSLIYLRRVWLLVLGAIALFLGRLRGAPRPAGLRALTFGQLVDLVVRREQQVRRELNKDVPRHMKITAKAKRLRRQARGKNEGA